MSASTRNPVVDLALDLLCELPHVAALDVLDHAMRAARGRQPDFRNTGPTAALYADHRDPPSPFAELLRRAFAPGLDPRDMALVGLLGKTRDPQQQSSARAAAARWQEVIDQFSERYSLWNAAPQLLHQVSDSAPRRVAQL